MRRDVAKIRMRRVPSPNYWLTACKYIVGIYASAKLGSWVADVEGEWQERMYQASLEQHKESSNTLPKMYEFIGCPKACSTPFETGNSM